MNKKIFITGASGGIGLSICEKFKKKEYQLILTSSSKEKINFLQNKFGNDNFYYKIDISENRILQNSLDQIAADHNDISVIVNNAGITHMPDFIENISYEEFEKVLNVNVKSVFLMSKAFVPEMKKRKSGVILNIASTAGISPRPRLTWYNATKGWMITATKSLAVELAPFKIRVNAINPVAGETPLLKTFMGEDTPEIRQKFLSTIPLGRFSTPEDMGNAAVFLCSEKASMITGVALEVDGGRCI